MSPLDADLYDALAERWTARSENPAPGAVAKAPAGLAARPLMAADLAALIDLRRSVVTGLTDEDCYVPEPDHFVRAHLGMRGETIGLFADDRLIAYSMLGLPPGNRAVAVEPADPMADALGIPAPYRAAAAHLASTMVRSEWRGCGLHKWLIRHRLARCAALGRRHVMAMVSPRNVASWHNLMRHGLTIRAVAPLEGDRPRYLLYLEMDKAKAYNPETGISVALADLDRQRAVLSQGYVGIGLAGAVPDAAMVFQASCDVERSTQSARAPERAYGIVNGTGRW